jgi:hypothetical protein
MNFDFKGIVANAAVFKAIIADVKAAFVGADIRNITDKFLDH